MALRKRPKGWHKFGAVKTVRDGFTFASKKEAQRYDELKLLVRAGEVAFFLRQVPIHLPGNTKYVVDFVIFWMDGNCTFEDSKGHRTTDFKFKKKQVEALYPIKIIES